MMWPSRSWPSVARRDDLHIGRAVEVILRSELFFSGAEPARPGLRAGRLRHRHGAEPRALRPATEHALARRVDPPAGPGTLLPAQRRGLARRPELAVGPHGGRARQLRRGTGRGPLARRIQQRRSRPSQLSPRRHGRRHGCTAVLRRVADRPAIRNGDVPGDPEESRDSTGGSPADRFNRAVALLLSRPEAQLT